MLVLCRDPLDLGLVTAAVPQPGTTLRMAACMARAVEAQLQHVTGVATRAINHRPSTSSQTLRRAGIALALPASCSGRQAASFILCLCVMDIAPMSREPIP